ncbi:Sm B [Zygosaccharomyces mellis]|uniref:Sm protein B n=1 Tax=Zygosaccharomyces mellis TaxID=42258 RepID=A0A4C2EGP5_9SACH|nr:Sm B [Zygosaccharomyces mellis]
MSQVQVRQDARLPDLIGFRLRVLTQDGRVYVGELLAFDKFMNLVLKNCIEERIPRTQLDKLKDDNSDKTNIKVEKRTLGLAILRGEQVLSTVVQDKPQLSKRERIDGVKKQEKKIDKGRRSRNKQARDKKSGKIEKKKFQPPPGLRKRV